MKQGVTKMKTRKEVRRNKETKDWAMFLNGEYVGSRDTLQEATAELDRLALEAHRAYADYRHQFLYRVSS